MHFYAGSDDLTTAVGNHLSTALSAGGVAVVIATSAHRAAFKRRLEDESLDVVEARVDGRLVMLDAAEILGRFLVDGRPDPDRFEVIVGGIVRDAGASGRPVRAYGEMVALLWDEGNVGGALEVEALWNALGERMPFSLFCAYPLASVADASAGTFREVCELHSDVLGSPAPQTFPPTVDSVVAARRFVVAAVDDWDMPELVDDAALVVTELATNAVRHTGADFTVAVWRLGRSVRVSVRDPSAVPPMRCEPAATARSGRGMRLVEAVAAAWGAEALGAAGKAVWADIGR